MSSASLVFFYGNLLVTRDAIVGIQIGTFPFEPTFESGAHFAVSNR
jgi:hypothetical protein